MSKQRSKVWSRVILVAVASLLGLYAVAQVVQPTTEFAVTGVSNENANGRPTAVLRFNRPLDTSQVFDALVHLSTPEGGKVDGSWMLAHDARTLEFPFLQTLSSYQIRVDAELRAADGSTLAGVFQQQISTQILPASVRFLSNGSVIPRHAHQGLPIASTNMESVDVEFLRVHPANYASFFLGYQLPYGRWPGVRRQAKRAGGDSEEEYHWKSELERITDFTESVYQQRFTLDHPGGQQALSYLPVHRIKELREPGVYMAVMKQPNNFPGSWHSAYFVVTDLGLHARRYGNSVWVHAASLKTGKALAGTRIKASGDGGISLGEAVTDAQGNALIKVAPQGFSQDDDDTPQQKSDSNELLLLSGAHDDDIAMLPFNQPAVDLSALPISGRQQQAFDIYSWGSRDLYRPGETLRVHLLVRDHDGHMRRQNTPLIAQLLNPEGENVENRALEVGPGGYASYSYKLADNAVTGLYLLRLSTDGNNEQAPFSMNLHVEEFLPERLKIDLDSDQATLAPGENLRLKAQSSYLYGAPAGGNRFVASMVLTPADHPVELYKDFHFGDASARFDSTPTEVLDDVFDEQGEISAEIDLSQVARDKGPIEVKILGEVQESGGRAVNKLLKRVIWPAPVLLGMRPQFDDDSAPGDTTAKLDLIASDVSGQRHSVSGVKVRILRDWRDYSWYYRNDNSFDVSIISSTTVESTQTIDLAAAGRPFELQVPIKWGGYWVELTHPDSGVVSRYHFQAGWSWGGDSQIAREPRPDQIKLELNQAAYRIGDMAELSIHAPHAGPGFVVVESDQQLFYAEINAGPEAKVSIPIDERYQRHDIYISAVVLRPDGSKDALVPSRAVGMLHLPLDRSERSLAVALDLPRLARPGESMGIQVDVPQLAGQQAFVVLTAVDQGITNITRYRVPDPAGFFFGQRRFGLDLYDIYGRVVENYAGARAGLRYGGDGESPELPEMPRDQLKVQLIDLYQGPVTLDAKGQATIKLTAPDFDGTLDVTALVFSDDRFGKATSEPIVRAPVVAQLSAPRALAPGDVSTLALDVRNMSGSAQTIGIKLGSEGGIQLRDLPKAPLALADGAKQTFLMGLDALAIGPASIEVEVSTAEGQVRRSVSTVVRPAYAPVRRIERSSVTGPIKLQPPASLVAGMLPGARLQFTVSNRPLLPLASAAQEVTEKLWWYTYLKLNVQRGFVHLLMDSNNRQLFGVRSLDESSRRALIQSVIDDSVAQQTPLGHFFMWGKDSWVDTQLTPYVAEFWIKAKKAGFRVDDSALNRTLSRMRQDLQNGGNAYLAHEHHEAIKFANNAHAAYVLSLTNAAPIGTLRTLYNEHAKDARTMLPLVQLGLALRTMGDKNLGDQALGLALNGKWDKAWGIGDYGSAERDLAWSHALLVEHKLMNAAWEAKVLPLGRNLSGRSRDQRWKGSYFSLDEAVALVRLGVQLLQQPTDPLKGTMVSGKTQQAIDRGRQFSFEFAAADIAQTSAMLDSTGALYVEWNSVGFSKTPPPADQSQVAISREYYTLDGAAWTGSTLKQGDRLLVHLRVQAERDIRDAVLVDLQPGGLEVENLNLGDFSELASVKIEGRPVTDYTYGTSLRRQEYKDDRYLAAIDFSAWHGGTINLFYIARAVTPGDYVVPPPFIEDMFRPQVKGQGATVIARLKVE